MEASDEGSDLRQGEHHRAGRQLLARNPGTLLPRVLRSARPWGRPGLSRRRPLGQDHRPATTPGDDQLPRGRRETPRYHRNSRLPGGPTRPSARGPHKHPRCARKARRGSPVRDRSLRRLARRKVHRERDGLCRTTRQRRPVSANHRRNARGSAARPMDVASTPRVPEGRPFTISESCARPSRGGSSGAGLRSHRIRTAVATRRPARTHRPRTSDPPRPSSFTADVPRHSEKPDLQRLHHQARMEH